MPKAKQDKKLYSKMRDNGIRKSVAKELSELPARVSGGRQAPKPLSDAVDRLEGLVQELKSHVESGERKTAARKGARTRGQNAASRSASARKGARTRAKASSGSTGTARSASASKPRTSAKRTTSSAAKRTSAASTKRASGTASKPRAATKPRARRSTAKAASSS